MLYTIFAGPLLIYVSILIFDMLGANYWARLINIPESHIRPVILVLCVIGAIMLRGNVSDAWIMLGADVLGYATRLQGYPLVPMVLGLILTSIAEENLRRSLVLSGGLSTIFLTSSIVSVIILLSLGTIAFPTVHSIRASA